MIEKPMGGRFILGDSFVLLLVVLWCCAGGLCVWVGVCSVVWVVAAVVLLLWGCGGCGWLFENSIVCCLFFWLWWLVFWLVIVM